jgi:hypothetical protein
MLDDRVDLGRLEIGARLLQVEQPPAAVNSATLPPMLALYDHGTLGRMTIAPVAGSMRVRVSLYCRFDAADTVMLGRNAA